MIAVRALALLVAVEFAALALLVARERWLDRRTRRVVEARLAEDREVALLEAWWVL